MDIPKNHQTIMPYLMLEGAKNFIHFAGKVFDASQSYHSTSDDGETIMHAELMIGNSTIMYSEATDQWQQQTANLFVYVANADEAYERALANGATIVMPPADQSYGRSCGVKDPFGNTWWITSVLPG